MNHYAKTLAMLRGLRRDVELAGRPIRGYSADKLDGLIARYEVYAQNPAAAVQDCLNRCRQITAHRVE